MAWAEIYESIIWLISGGLLIGGSIFAIIGGIGICRLPEFFSRMHGAGITDTMGAGLILLGLMVQAGVSLVTFKLLIILFFLLVTSPSSCHALARSALAHGLEPELDVPQAGNQFNSNSSRANNGDQKLSSQSGDV